MLFQSSEFLIQFILFFTVFQLMNFKGNESKKILLLAFSLWFYFSWEVNTPDLNQFDFFIPFFTILFSSLVLFNHYFLSLIISSDEKKRKFLLAFSLLTIFLPLCIYKYFPFFTEVFLTLFNLKEVPSFITKLKIGNGSILPLGISFITFQLASYIIDSYRAKERIARTYREAVLYIFYFPQLIAGPIMRANDLILQLRDLRPTDKKDIQIGHYYFFKGLIKKVLIADSLSLFVDPVFENLSQHSFVYLFLISSLYAFQIYFDFSGYSDMAIGISRYLGIKLMKNFDHPYLALNPQDFWRRWHISLSTWFRDYVYIPLGGTSSSRSRYIITVMITFLLSGLWHGAGYNFISWGAYHGLLLVIYVFSKNKWDSLPLYAQRGMTFFLIILGWILFRVNSLSDLFSCAGINLLDKERVLVVGQLGVVIILWGIHFFSNRHLEKFYFKLGPVSQSILCALVLFFVAVFSNTQNKFIYFQF